MRECESGIVPNLAEARLVSRAVLNERLLISIASTSDESSFLINRKYIEPSHS